MAQNAFLLILTLVLGNHLSWANPHGIPDATKPTLKNEAAEKPTELSSEVIEDYNLSPGQVPLQVEQDALIYQKYENDQAISIRYGTLFNSQATGDELFESFRSVYGFQYLYTTSNGRLFETGADLVRSQQGQVHFSRRWSTNVRSSFRAFTKLGLMFQADASDGLGTFVDHKNYFLKSSVGFEDSLRKSQSIRFDLELSINLEDIFLFAGASWVWGF